MSTTQGAYHDGGAVMLIIALVGIVGLVILIERAYVIVLRSKNNGRPFIERIIQLVRGGKIDEAIKACASSTAALPDMGLLILRSRSRDESDLQNVADAAALAVVPKLTRRLHYLPVLALVAGLIGLFGTIRGCQAALADTALLGAARTAQLSLELSDSLTSVAFGLAVAIILTLGRVYLVSQSESITDQIQEFSARLINALIDRPDVRLGHR